MVATLLALLDPLLVPLMISAPFTLILLTVLLVLMPVMVMVAAAPTVMVVVGIAARRNLVNRVLTAAPSITVVEPITLLHSW